MFYSLASLPRYTNGVSSMDNFIFKLCYRWTTLLLVVFSFIVSCRLLFGNSFSCIIGDDALTTRYANVKCYDEGTYTVPRSLNNNKGGIPGIDSVNEDYKRYQSYYSWVNLLLLVHAFNFYLPHLLWKSYEGGHLYGIFAGIIHKEEKRHQDFSYFAMQIVAHFGFFKKYTLAYVFFEACNFAVSLAQTVWLIIFFRVTGVPEDESGELATWSGFRDIYFPQEAVCEITKISAAGALMKFRHLCQLPLNSLYMKMFLFLLAWYILLTILCGLVVIYRILLFLFFSMRLLVVKLSSPFSSNMDLSSVITVMSSWDYIFLLWLKRAMTDFDFAQLIKEIASHVNRKHLFEDEEEAIVLK